MFFKSVLTKFLSQGRQRLWMKGRTQRKQKPKFIGTLRPEDRHKSMAQSRGRLVWGRLRAAIPMVYLAQERNSGRKVHSSNWRQAKDGWLLLPQHGHCRTHSGNGKGVDSYYVKQWVENKHNRIRLNPWLAEGQKQAVLLETQYELKTRNLDLKNCGNLNSARKFLWF